MLAERPELACCDVGLLGWLGHFVGVGQSGLHARSRGQPVLPDVWNVSSARRPERSPDRTSGGETALRGHDGFMVWGACQAVHDRVATYRHDPRSGPSASDITRPAPLETGLGASRRDDQQLIVTPLRLLNGLLKVPAGRVAVLNTPPTLLEVPDVSCRIDRNPPPVAPLTDAIRGRFAVIWRIVAKGHVVAAYVGLPPVN